MEDAHTTILDLLASDPEAAKAHKSKLSFFGVYDGHGGDKVALFAGKNVQNIIAKQDTFKKGEYEQSLKDGFLATDRAILNGTVLAYETAKSALCPLPNLKALISGTRSEV
jgi:protein phosphatase PTC2/3